MTLILKKSVAEMVKEANSQITCLNTTQAHGLLNSSNHIFIDLRDFRELKKIGKINNAFSCPRGMLEFWIDPNSPYHKKIFDQDLILFNEVTRHHMALVFDDSRSNLFR